MEKRILIVDDECSVREMLELYLNLMGYQVTQAPNGKAGLATALDEPPDLIISDCRMPIMNGYDFLKALRDEPETKDIPFFFLSATAEDVVGHSEAERLGVSRCLGKPWSWDELTDAIHNAIGDSAAS